MIARLKLKLYLFYLLIIKRLMVVKFVLASLLWIKTVIVCLLWEYNNSYHQIYNIKPISSNRRHLFLGARPFRSLMQRRFEFVVITKQLPVELCKGTKIVFLKNFFHFNYLQFKVHLIFFFSFFCKYFCGSVYNVYDESYELI